MKLRDFLRHLQQQGCILAREGSNHAIWENPVNGKRTAVPRHRELVDFTAKAICQQLEIPLPF